MNPGEADVLVALMRSVAPRRVVEIGVNEGLSARDLLAHVPSIADYVGIDVLPGYRPGCAVQRHEVPANPGHVVADPRFTLWLRRAGSLDLTAAALGPCDAMFIDGDHSRDAVRADSALARACVRPGGLVVWHDYHDRGTVDVRDVLDAMMLSAPERAIFHVEGTWLAFERVPAAA
jgi:predicted O-methyltransferase YrrM